MKAMKNVRSAHVFDLNIKGILFGVWDLLQKLILFGKYHKKTIILLGAQLLCINTNQMTSSPEIRK